MSDFIRFAKMVTDDFQSIVSNARAFVVGFEEVEAEAPHPLYDCYQKAFPDGTNPMFRKRLEHDCSMCKQFIRRAGNVVAIDSQGKMHTVWDKAAEKAPYPYNVVAKAMQEKVRAAKVVDLFCVNQSEKQFGKVSTLSMVDEKVESYNHFCTGDIPASCRHKLPDQIKGDYRTTMTVFERGLNELRPDVIETILELIKENGFYKCEEYRHAVTEFQKAQKAYLSKQTETEKSIYVWTNAFGPAARFKNTLIGELISEICEGKPLDKAIIAYETRAAPQNYKRTTAVITQGMIKTAMETLKELDLESALERRFAKIQDVSVNDVLWVDGKVKPLMKGGLDQLGNMLMQVATSNKDFKKDSERAEDILIEDFLTKVLAGKQPPQSIELLFKGEHLGNLMSLTAPVHSDNKQLFRWPNDFAWSYGGNVTDSIKEKVKKAGGNVTNAKLRVSLSWFNTDDLDLHVYELPERSSSHIYYREKRGQFGGELDVDMNAGGRIVRDPVENVSWVKVPDGTYRVVVHNFNQRETSDVGFVIEVENNGKLSHFNCAKGVKSQENMAVVTLHVKNGNVEKFEVLGNSITTNAVSQEKWGLKTESYLKVNAIMLSPNYWNLDKKEVDATTRGNKHYMFAIDGAKNDEPTRGIYNEFLHPRLTQHRKVFEVIGDKTKCQPGAEGQLSGLGFSSTIPEEFLLRVQTDKRQHLYNVQVGLAGL